MDEVRVVCDSPKETGRLLQKIGTAFDKFGDMPVQTDLCDMTIDIGSELRLIFTSDDNSHTGNTISGEKLEEMLDERITEAFFVGYYLSTSNNVKGD